MICCVVGGIYTVIRTKAAVTVEELGDRYFLIGPYNETCVRTELDLMEPPNEAVARAFQQMRDHGLKVCSKWHCAVSLSLGRCIFGSGSFPERGYLCLLAQQGI